MPLSKGEEKAPAAATTVCGKVSVIFHVIVSPTAANAVPGAHDRHQSMVTGDIGKRAQRERVRQAAWKADDRRTCARTCGSMARAGNCEEGHDGGSGSEHSG